MSLRSFDHFVEQFRASGGKFADDLSIEVPEYFNFARDVLDVAADDPTKLALWWVSSDGQERRLTLGDIADQSRRAAALLASLGIARGDVVMVLLPRIPHWWVLNIACLRLGAIISPGPTQLRSADLEYRLQATGARCVIADAEVAARIEAIDDRCPELRTRIITGTNRQGWTRLGDGLATSSSTFESADTRADEIAAIYFTSGTEGPPKMVAHTHSSFPLRSRLAGVYWLDLDDGDLHWNLSDTGWAKAAWSSLYGPWNHGAAVFAVDSPRFSPAKVLDILARLPITTMCAAPTVYRSLLREAGSRIETHSLRHCVAAGEPLNPEVLRRWEEATGITIRDGYGQTESSLLLVNFPGMPVRPGSAGKPVPGYDVQVIDDGGRIMAAGEEGDLALRIRPLRPLGLFKEYYRDAAATHACRRGDWHITGDRAYRDADGYYWFVGRADDVIISSGYRIGPFEVESALLAHPAVTESAVVSSPDAIRGEVVKAFIVLERGYEPDDDLAGEIQEHVKAATAPYKYPRLIEFVEVLPKTSTGKIKRADLRRAEWGESAASE